MEGGDNKVEVLHLLQSQCGLLAEILSFTISSTQDFAALRLVSKTWNQNVLPYCLKSGVFLAPCNRDSEKFLETILAYGTEDYAYYFRGEQLGNIMKLWYAGEDEQENDDILRVLFGAEHCVQSMMFIGKPKELKFKGDLSNKDEELVLELFPDDEQSFPKLCERMYTTKDWKEFQELRQRALQTGRFASVEDCESRQFSFLRKLDDLPTERFQEFDSFAAILTVRSPKDAVVLESLSEDGYQTCRFDVKCRWKADDLGGHYLVPLSSCYFDVSDENKKCSFRGYIIDEDSEGGTITCLLPMLLALDPDECENRFGVEGETFLPISSTLREFQEGPAKEGISIIDGALPNELHASLMYAIDNFVGKQEADYHPHSNGIVRDIVHPALYSYVKDVSPLLRSVDDVAPALLPLGFDADKKDYWGRPYEASSKYQWLPTYFDIGLDGSCTICDYINNLVPRSEYEPLYSLLGQVFSHALPLFESAVSYGRNVRPLIRSEDTYIFDEEYPDEIPVERVSLRGQRLQVVTKIVDYELASGQTYEGVWHVEGMSHEEIVATSLYFERDDYIKGGNIMFKRAMQKDEAHDIFDSVHQSRPEQFNDFVHEGILPLGQVETISRRLIVFPNSHVHKVTTLENILPTLDALESSANEKMQVQKKKRRLIAFFLINPSRRIISTREVPMQQEHVGGSMRRDDAMSHRLELMKERKYTKQDWNVREIELCEH
mmetsp:Transcript_20943/g.31928  ORF Transcript_20943/g.31928 Transcript_20943/m.31928 type:complete len:720 (+) Transcript_20943:85-2244(+)